MEDKNIENFNQRMMIDEMSFHKANNIIEKMQTIGINFSAPTDAPINANKAILPPEPAFTCSQNKIAFLTNVFNMQRKYNNAKKNENARVRILTKETGYVNISLLFIGVVILTIITIASAFTIYTN